MKICFTANNKTLDAKIDPRFGRCQYLVFVDSTKEKIIKAIDNTQKDVWHGAGIATAQKVVNEDAKVVITGNIGPNAFAALQSAGIKIIAGISDLTLKQALEKFKNNDLEKIQNPSVNGHFGRGYGFGSQGGRRRRSGRK